MYFVWVFVESQKVTAQIIASLLLIGRSRPQNVKLHQQLVQLAVQVIRQSVIEALSHSILRVQDTCFRGSHKQQIFSSAPLIWATLQHIESVCIRQVASGEREPSMNAPVSRQTGCYCTSTHVHCQNSRHLTLQLHQLHGVLQRTASV